MIFDEFKEHVEVRDYIMSKLCPSDVPRQEFLAGLMKFTLSCLSCTLSFNNCLNEASPHSHFTEEETLQTVELLQRATGYQISEYTLRLFLFEACRSPDFKICEPRGVIEKPQLLEAVEEAYYVGAGLVSSCNLTEEGTLN
mmetsp:Transcript_17366/g.31338  ORF Transcript_17366/g.31338 Transcript_17366/m.31338 type:complete len:141 (+) Transcript_17366:83-505(+)